MEPSNQPKYIYVMEQIKEYINTGQLKEDDKVPSEHTLTNQLKVSRHTVRKAIGNLVNEGWLYTAQGKGTFVANRLKPNSSSTNQLVGVITTYIKDYIFPNIIEGIDQVLVDEGYSILLGNTHNQIEKERQCIINMMNNGVRALIVEPTKSALPNPNIDLYRQLQEQGVPILFIHGCYGNLPSAYIVEDDVKGGYEATMHLLELGHKKIGGIFKSDDIQGHLRYEGYIKAHREKGISIHEDMIQWYTTEDAKNLFNNNSNLINRLKHCTGMVCYNDQIAVKVLELLKKEGLDVPGDISMVSFDNSKLGQLAELTSVAHPKREMGKQAATAILRMIGNKKIIEESVLETEIVYGQTTRRIKDNDLAVELL